MNLNSKNISQPGTANITKVTDEELLALKPLKPRKKATFDSPTPSNYCHICSRTPNRGIRLAVCSGLQQGQCRKVVCERCFKEYPLGSTFEQALDASHGWKCTHCQGICPQRAQCRTYQNVNRKLRLQRLRQSVAAPPPRDVHTPIGGQGSQTLSPHYQSRFIAEPVLPPLTERPAPTKGLVTTNPEKSNTHDHAYAASPNSVAHAGPNFGLNKKRATDLIESTQSKLGRHTTLSSVTGTQRRYNIPAGPKPHENTSSSNSGKKSTGNSPDIPLIACHLCGCNSSHKAVFGFKTCSAIQNTSCRAAFCNNCCTRERDLVESIAAAEKAGNRWTCCHCTGSCPEHGLCSSRPKDVTETEQVTAARAVASIQRKQKSNTSLKSRLLAAATECHAE